MLILAQIYILICTMFLAGKDASSYLLKGKNDDSQLVTKRIKRWHRDGAILNALFIVPIVYLNPALYLIIPYAILIRLTVFDLVFNKYAKLDYNYLGSTALVDRFFNKIFGDQGAVKKSLAFGLVLIILNILLK